MRHQFALQAVGQFADNADDIFHMPVQHQAQTVQLLIIAEFGSRDDFIKTGVKNAIGIFGVATVLGLTIHV